MHHSWRRKNDAGPDVVEVIDSFEVGDVLEHERVVDGDLATNSVVHRIYERLKREIEGALSLSMI